MRRIGVDKFADARLAFLGLTIAVCAVALPVSSACSSAKPEETVDTLCPAIECPDGFALIYDWHVDPHCRCVPGAKPLPKGEKR